MTVATKEQRRATIKLPELVKEEIHGVVIEYYPIGKYVVIQPDVQGGLPTIKNTRITAGVLVGWVEKGYSPEEVARDYRIAPEAVVEAIELAKIYDYDRRYV